MCGRYVLVEVQDLEERFSLEKNNSDVQPTYNAAPSQMLPVITRNSPTQVHLMKWGLVPSWSKDLRIGYKMINARAEGIQDKPSFRSALTSRRCLVPSSGFYEWKRHGIEKTPYYIHLKQQPLFAYAGLYEIRNNADGAKTYSYTIITTEANEVMKSIHSRMPVILNRADEDEWLDSKVTDPEQITRLLQPYRSDRMDLYPVSTEVNTPAHNSPDLLVPALPEEGTNGGPNPL